MTANSVINGPKNSTTYDREHKVLRLMNEVR